MIDTGGFRADGMECFNAGFPRAEENGMGKTGVSRACAVPGFYHAGHIKRQPAFEGTGHLREITVHVVDDPDPCPVFNTGAHEGCPAHEKVPVTGQPFLILIELKAFPHLRISLERNGEDLGEYDVLSSEPLTTVGRTQIMV